MYASVGEIGILTHDTATSQAFYNMVFDDDRVRDFIYYRLFKAAEQAEYEPLISTGTQRNLNAEKIKNFTVQVTSVEEMGAIGHFFRKLDDLISLHQQQTQKGKIYFILYILIFYAIITLIRNIFKKH